MIQFDKHLLDRSKVVHVSFSGGVDSLATAVFLRNGGWNVKLIHVQHMLNQYDLNIANGCKRSAFMLGLPLVTLLPTKGQSKLLDASPSEAACSIVRRELTKHLDQLVLAHHKNDLAEGYFQNCIKGTPMKVPLRAVSGNRIRPFLRTTKQDFIDFLSNKEERHLVVPEWMGSQRQLLREQVFPLVGTDFSRAATKLFIDTGLIYDVS